MTSNLQIQRICQFCGKQFTARTTVTKFCGDDCAKRAYKARKRSEKVVQSNIETRQIINRPIEVLNSKELLTIDEACQLISVSRWTLWRLMKAGKLSYGKFGRQVRITRSDIDAVFKPVLIIPESAKTSKDKEPFNIENFYSITEVQEKFDISEKALYDLIKRNNIDKIKSGKFVLVSKLEIEKHLRTSVSLFD